MKKITRLDRPPDGGPAYEFGSSEGKIEAYLVDDMQVSPYLISLSSYDVDVRVCPHLVHAGMELQRSGETEISHSLNGVSLGCEQCMKIKDMRKLVVADYHIGSFRLVFMKFPGELYACYMTSQLEGARFQGMGWDVMTHWLRIVKDTGWKTEKALAERHLEAAKLKYVTEKI